MLFQNYKRTGVGHTPTRSVLGLLGSTPSKIQPFCDSLRRKHTHQKSIKMLSKSLVMPLCVLLAASALASNFDNNQEDDYEENSNALGFSRERRFNALSSDKKKYCGERLYAMVRMICQARGKRQAIPEPAYPGNLSPFLMSIYRPIMDEDNLITENWEQWKLESPSSRDRFQKISMLRNLQKRAINMGISDVCCRHQCSLQDIARFC